MAVDDLVEGLLRAIARPLVEGFVEIFRQGICGYVGFWTLRRLSAAATRRAIPHASNSTRAPSSGCW